MKSKVGLNNNQSRNVSILTSSIIVMLLVTYLFGCSNTSNILPTKEKTPISEIPSTNTALSTLAINNPIATPAFEESPTARYLTPTPSSTLINGIPTEVNHPPGTHLELVRNWDVPDISSHSTSFWFYDNKRFAFLVGNEIRLYRINQDNFSDVLQTEGYARYIVDSNDQIIVYNYDLYVYGHDGSIIKKINNLCDRKDIYHMIKIPNTEFIITAQADSISDFGLNYNLRDKYSIILWNISDGSCKIVASNLDGRVSWVSTNGDNIIAYSYYAKSNNSDYWDIRVSRILNIKTGKELCAIASDLTVFTNNEDVIAYNQKDNNFTLYNTDYCEKEVSFPAKMGLAQLYISKNILFGTDTNTGYLWDIENLKQVYEFDIDKSNMALPQIGFSPDGNYLITTERKNPYSQQSGKINLWKVIY